MSALPQTQKEPAAFADASDEQVLKYRYRWAKKVATQTLAATAFVYADRSLVSLNEVGSFVWGLCAEGVSGADVLVNIQDEFDVQPTQALSDLVKFFKDMVERGLLEYD